MTVRVLQGDCVEVLARLEPDSFAACVCDPPYHLHSITKRFANSPRSEATENARTPHGRTGRGFMGKTWDGGDVAFRPETWAAVLRVLKPGTYLVAFASTRGYHRMVCAIEDAGFVIHPMLGWLFASGFPKAHNLSKAIDRAAGFDRGTAPDFRNGPNTNPKTKGIGKFDGWTNTGIAEVDAGAVTEAAKQWEGWAYGLQSLKPALEPICLAQKPFAEVTSAEVRAATGWDHWCSQTSDGDDRIVTARALHPAARSYRLRLSKDGRELAREDLGAYRPFVIDNGTANVLRWGTGAINVDAGRVEGPMDGVWGTSNATVNRERKFNGSPGMGEYRSAPHAAGRWPANLAHDGSPEVLEAFARFSAPGQQRMVGPEHGAKNSVNCYGDFGPRETFDPRGDTGTAARFFFCGKAQAWERESNHPTVKPIALMEWLVNLVTPPGGQVLDPFCGTGSTLVACDWLGIEATGIEQDPQTCADAERKIKRLRARRLLGPDAPRDVPLPGQGVLL